MCTLQFLTIHSSYRFIAVHVIDESVQEQSTASTGSVESYHGKEQISPFKLSTVSSLKAETKHNVLSVLQGDFSKYIYLKAKIVRIFISSTFTGKQDLFD